MDDDDIRYMRMAIEESHRSVAKDARVHPSVGAVVVKEGRLLAVAHRGESAPGDHAEFAALEIKLPGEVVAGSTVVHNLRTVYAP
jgi:pyrimidine deaminase RibD-like protein